MEEALHCWRSHRTDPSGACCCTCCPGASNASATTACWPTVARRRSSPEPAKPCTSLPRAHRRANRPRTSWLAWQASGATPAPAAKDRCIWPLFWQAGATCRLPGWAPPSRRRPGPGLPHERTGHAFDDTHSMAARPCRIRTPLGLGLREWAGPTSAPDRRAAPAATPHRESTGFTPA